MELRRREPARPRLGDDVRLRHGQAASTARRTTRFLAQSFQKLLLNFTWWVNRKDARRRNVFEGGFLGLDNIGVFDRSSPLPTGGFLEQADGTAWMAFYCLNMLEIALELADTIRRSTRTWCSSSSPTSCWIAAAMDRIGEHADEMWDEEDGFFYDVLRLPDGTAVRLKVRSMVGLLPICATTVIEPEAVAAMPELPGSRAHLPGEATPNWRATIGLPRQPGARGATCCPRWTRTSCAACCGPCSTRRSSSAPTASRAVAPPSG
jgi:hypothetical protein